MDQERLQKGLYWDRAWSLVSGCSPVSPGCDNCWAAAEAEMRAHHPNPKIHERVQELTECGGFLGRVRCNEDLLGLPLRTRKPTVFAVWTDLYHESVSDNFRNRAYAVMALRPQHTFLVLTKRANRMAEYWDAIAGARLNHIAFLASSARDEHPKDSIGTVGAANLINAGCLPNVWHGVTVEKQEQADERIPHLLRVPGRRFLSVEPMLGPVDLLNLGRPFEFHCSPYGWPQWLGRKIHAVLLGGESGLQARPMNPQWARDVRDACCQAGIPFFFKQWGEWVSVSEVDGAGVHHWLPDGRTVRRVGKKRAGRSLDGRRHDDLPWGEG